ncbi:MAG: hypothetical protein RL762_727 [Bacteroidota bacterium]|jgi:phosphorylcholine metabolism protein LicD
MKKSPYEGKTHFGWEEWLFRDLLDPSQQHNGYCYGFIQAFHGKNKDKTIIENLYLYSKECIGTNSKTFLIGMISNVEIVKKTSLTKDEKHKIEQFIEQVKCDLNHPDFIDYSSDFRQMCEANSLYNVRFKPENVQLIKTDLSTREIRLPHGWYRFNLYDLNKKPKLHSQLNQLLK